MDNNNPEEYHPDPKAADTVHDSGVELQNIADDARVDEAKASAPIPPNTFVSKPAPAPVEAAPMDASRENPNASSPKKRGKLIALIVAIVLVLCGAGTAAGFMIWRSQPEVMAMDAVVNFLNTTTIKTNGNFVVDINNGDQKGQAVFAFDAEGSGIAHRFNGSLSINLGDDSYELAFKEAFTQDHVLYFQVDGIQETINSLNEDIKSTVQPVLELFSETIELADGTWWRVSVPEVMESLSDQISPRDRQRYENLYNCAIDAVEKGAKSGELAEMYKKHPFVTIEEYKGDAFKDVKKTLYKIDVKVGKAREFIKEDFTELTVYKELKTCMADADIDIDQYIDSAENSIPEDESSESSNPEATFAVAIDGWSHKLTGVYLSVPSASEYSSSAYAQMEFSYPGKVEITAPADARPIKDLLEQVITDFSNMSGMMYTGFDDYYYEDKCLEDSKCESSY